MKPSDSLSPRSRPTQPTDTGPAECGPGKQGGTVINFAERLWKLGSSMKASNTRQKAAGAEELAFLPAALEIVETPASPVGRATAFTLMAVFAIALVWSCIGTVDIVAVASGKIIPSGRTKTIQPFETGVVRAIHVRDGQSVKAGDVLIELDPTMSEAEGGHIRGDLMAAQLDVARLRAAATAGDDPLRNFVAPRGATAAQIEMQRGFLTSQHAEQAAKLANIVSQESQKTAERATVLAMIEKINAILPIIKQRVEVRETLMKKEIGSKLLYFTELQDYVTQEQEANVQRSRLNEIDAALAGLVETRRRTEAEYYRSLLDDLAKAEQKVSTLTQDMIKAENRTRLQSLRAPEDGVVQQLVVHTIGGVVTPAQALMVVVPADSQLEIEAMVSNRDIGFVEAGQDAAIKIDTFNFTRYGLLQGKVLTVSQDAITHDKPQDKTTDKAQVNETGSSEPKGQELVYAARVSLNRSHMQIDNKSVALGPGMAVSVEIKTGTRSIISYLLSPLMRYGHESFRER